MSEAYDKKALIEMVAGTLWTSLRYDEALIAYD